MKLPDNTETGLTRSIRRTIDLIYIWLFFWGIGNFIEFVYWMQGLPV